MHAIKRVKEFIASNPLDPQAMLLTNVMHALRDETSLSVVALYDSDLKVFDLMLDLIKEWRLDRYYASKWHLLDADPSGSHVAEASQGVTPH